MTAVTTSSDEKLLMTSDKSLQEISSSLAKHHHCMWRCGSLLLPLHEPSTIVAVLSAVRRFEVKCETIDVMSSNNAMIPANSSPATSIRTGGMAPPEILNPGTVAENYSGGWPLTIAS